MANEGKFRRLQCEQAVVGVVNEGIEDGDISLIESMEGYSFVKDSSHATIVYAGVVKNGNKLTFALSFIYNQEGSTGDTIGKFTIPSAIYNKLIPTTIPDTATDNILEIKSVLAQNGSVYSAGTSVSMQIWKDSDNRISFTAYGLGYLTTGKSYLIRSEATYLLSDNLAN